MKYLRNKTLKVSLLVLFVFNFSCSDLNEEPRNLLSSDTFFNDAADVEAAVMGGHALLASVPLYGRNILMQVMLRSDMVSIGDPGTSGHRISTDDFSLSAVEANAGDLRGVYERAFLVIGAANNALRGADIVGDGTPGVKALRAEARFLRGFMYYHLVRLYGGVTLLEGILDDPSEAVTLGRASEDEVYNLIIEDFTYAKAELPDSYSGGLRSRPTKGTAAAYLASVYLTRENYSGAYTESKFVIDNAGRFGYALEDDYQKLFLAPEADNLVEPLMTFDFSSSVSTGFGGTNNDFTAPINGPRSIRVDGKTGWSVTVPTNAVFDTWPEGDYRKDVSFITEGIAPQDMTVPGPDGEIGTADDVSYTAGDVVPYQDWDPVWNARLVPRAHIAKWFINCKDAPGCQSTNNNYIAMRYAEVLLIAAEAAVMGGGGSAAEAIDYVNQIRARSRGGADGLETTRTVPADFSGTLTRDDIIEERRFELSFEWKRWYDIKRLGIGPEVFGPSGLETWSAFDPNVHYYFPIPQLILQNNESLNQNPGY